MSYIRSLIYQHYQPIHAVFFLKKEKAKIDRRSVREWKERVRKKFFFSPNRMKDSEMIL
jgi:hypothetical protein